MRKVMQDIINTELGVTYFPNRIWRISQRYDLQNTHPLISCSASDFEFDDGLRLGKKLEKGGFLLLTLRTMYGL
ncbi:hypothetical protein BGW36DRAFT_366273 [Talaromyces proteolyticus]|uniref:Uncharacterized protein n=1 Tax=Talaromyces proteolyticus TaxID=1131652 RepID=A0AAD4L0J8_9EURO|nr:uncharacterized protein BGW36DRAFT_366273 [Talaromyces proteolyticus]KAH8704849.1 hypothetical protein BGW36DRAFT_366273 [Talaromyces proteolyticus]